MSETPLANDRSGSTRAAWPWPLVPAALAVMMVVPALTSGTFVNDPVSVLRNPVVSTWRNLPVIFSQDFMIHTDGQYRPMSCALLAVVRTWVSADHTVFWHAWLAAFHALSAMLVFLLVMHFSRKTWAALTAGCLFAVHPMTVLYTSHMNTFVYVLAGTLYLATLFAYFRFVRSRRPATFVLALVLFACGLLTSKMLLTLPVLLVLYELLYEREGVVAALKRLLPMGACVLATVPLRLWLTPHPMFFNYPLFPAGSQWTSFYTFLGRTFVHVQGVFGGYGFEAPLDERTRWVLGVGDERFPSMLAWGIVFVAALVVSMVLLWRRRWAGLCVPLAVLSVTPYASTAFHRSRQIISWDYLYLVVAALALGVGALAASASRLRGVRARRLSAALFVLLVAGSGVLHVRAELRTRSAETWWQHVLRVNPDSSTASVELGKAALERDDLETALGYLFSPRVRNTYRSSLAMMGWYAADNQPLAAALHFNSAPAVQLDEVHAQNAFFMTAAGLVYEARVLDYVEQAMGQVLMSDPWHTGAMRMMARALADKGRVRASCRLLERALEIDPGDVRTVELLGTVRKRLYAPAPVGSTRVPPPDFDWLEYLLDDRVNERLRDRILKLADELRADPVVQYQAARILLDAGKSDLARPLVARAAGRMPRHPTVVELVRRLEALTRADSGEGRGDPTLLNHWGYTLLQQNRLDDAAVQFHAVLRIDPKNADAHNNLGLVCRLQGKHDLALEHYRSVIELVPHEPEGYRTLAAELRGLARNAESVQVLERGLKAVPDDVEMKLRLAWMLSTAPEPQLRNGSRAVTLAETVCRAEGFRDPAHLGILAAAWAETGDFDKAVETSRRAATLAAERQDAPLEKTLNERTTLYTKRQPYRLPKPGASP